MQTALPVPSPARLSIQHLFALILAAVVFTPLLALAFYTGPSADDFCTAILMRDLGFVATQVKFYLSWSGRYATSAIVGLLTGHSAWITAYSLVPIALIFLTFASITFLIRSAFVFLKAPSPAHNTLALGVVATAMTFGLTPSLAEMIYWTSGALTYQLSFIVTMLTCSLTLLMLSRDTLDVLTRFKAARALPTWDHVIEQLLKEAGEEGS